MYYALTIKDGIITGVHESEKPITDKTFAINPKLAVQEVLPFTNGEYREGHALAEYKDGILRPILDRINDGLADIPEGFELIDGEPVKRDVPVEEAPPKLLDLLSAAAGQIAALEAELAALKPKVATLEAAARKTP